jgi:glycosyltransferase involved in cell wall biosynthesis
MISIIIPTLNEEKIIRSTLENLSLFTRGRSYEIIVSDGGSQDYTVKIAKQYAKIVISKKGKAIQLNTGAKKAKGKILFFLPADITVPDGALEAIERKIFKQGYDGGGFSNVFSNYNNKIKTLGRIMNLRIFDNDNKRNLIFYGDNGIFCKKEVFNRLRGFKRIPIMEASKTYFITSSTHFKRFCKDSFSMDYNKKIIPSRCFSSYSRKNVFGY